MIFTSKTRRLKIANSRLGNKNVIIVTGKIVDSKHGTSNLVTFITLNTCQQGFTKTVELSLLRRKKLLNTSIYLYKHPCAHMHICRNVSKDIAVHVYIKGYIRGTASIEKFHVKTMPLFGPT